MEFDLVDRGLDELGAVIDHVELDARRGLALDFRKLGAYLPYDLHRVGARLAKHRQQDAALVVEPALHPHILDTVLGSSYVRQPHRHAVLVEIGRASYRERGEDTVDG